MERRRFRRLPHSVAWTHEFDHPPELVWELISNTDRMNRATGLADVKYVDAAGAGDTLVRRGQAREFGFDLQWVEKPYEWEKERYFRVERAFDTGPYRKIDFHCELQRTERGCRARSVVSFEPRVGLIAPLAKLQFAMTVKRRLNLAYSQITRSLSTVGECPWPPLRADIGPFAPELIARLRDRLRSQGLRAADAEQLLQFIFHSQEPDLVKIRPYAIARQWQRDRHEVLSTLLAAAKAGVLSLSWDVLCPGCRGAKQRADSLAKLDSTTHCDSCNIDYGPSFDRSVEISFRVARSVRSIDVGEFCIGGPMNTPHYDAQLRVAAGEVLAIEAELDEGTYLLRTQRPGQATERHRIEVRPNAATSATGARPARFDFGAPDARAVDRILKSGIARLEIFNGQANEITVVLERARWLEDACTAAELTNYQDFKDLFPGEVIKKGHQIEVGAIALLFTDLLGSTALYQSIGDGPAYALVQEHFEILTGAIRRHGGGVVKTIGDAVMAAFARPESAAAAAIEIQRAIAARFGDSMKLKVGVHYGSCYAVNLNDRLDYFGSAANLAARTEGQCEGADIMLSAAMIADAEVRRVVESSGLPFARVQRRLKGFDESCELMRIDCACLAASARAGSTAP